MDQALSRRRLPLPNDRRSPADPRSQGRPEAQRLRLRATRSAERKQKPSVWASRRGCEAAINGDYFSFDTYDTTGLALGDGKLWPGSKDGPGQGFLAAGKDNRIAITRPSAVVSDLPAWYWEVVGGRNALVFDGVRTDYPDCSSNPHCVRHPRTAVGMNKAGDVLFLVVVDGRSSASKGMDLNELGKLMLNLGSDRALNLDGGGSSAMWLGGGIVSHPSDSTGERTVGNHLAVLAKGSGEAVSCPIPMLDAKFVGQSSTAEPDPEGKAQFRVCAGEPFHFSFELENTGRASWVDWGDQGTSFGHNVRLGVPGDTLDVFTGKSRVSVNENANHDVHPPSWNPPGGECKDQLYCRRTVFTAGAGIAATAPSEPGVYKTTWRLVDEGRAWFGPEMWLSFHVVECDASETGAGAGGAEGGEEGAGAAPSGGPGLSGAGGGVGGAGPNLEGGPLEGSCACRAGGAGGARGALALSALGLLGRRAERARRRTAVLRSSQDRGQAAAFPSTRGGPRLGERRCRAGIG